MSNWAFRATFVWLLWLSVSYITTGCKRYDDFSLSEGKGEAGEFIEIAIVDRIHKDKQDFFLALKGEKRIGDNVLTKVIPRLMNVEITNEVKFIDAENTEVDDMSADLAYHYYRGALVGEQLFIFKKFDDGWGVVDVCPTSILSNKSNEEKIQYYMDAKYYEPERIANLTNAINNSDFVFHFIPGYGGAERIRDAETWGDVAFGVVQIAGDTAALAIGTPIKVIQQGAVVITLSAATARVSSAAYKANQGTASMADGIDALLATVEATIATVTVVKIKIPRPGHGTVENLDQAAQLSHILKDRTAQDILEKGLEAKDLARLGYSSVDEALDAALDFANVTYKEGELFRHIDGFVTTTVVDGKEVYQGIGGHTWEFFQKAFNKLDDLETKKVVNNADGTVTFYWRKLVGIAQGTGKKIKSPPKKSTVFPQSWTKQSIIHKGMNLLKSKNFTHSIGESGAKCVTGIIEGIEVFMVIISGNIETIYPTGGDVISCK